jgi:hypothetical protein
MIGTLAVAIATTPEARDSAGAFAVGVGLGLLGRAAMASATHSAPGYGYGPRLLCKRCLCLSRWLVRSLALPEQQMCRDRL